MATPSHAILLRQIHSCRLPRGVARRLGLGPRGGAQGTPARRQRGLDAENFARLRRAQRLLPFYAAFAHVCTFTVLRQKPLTFTEPSPYDDELWTREG